MARIALYGIAYDGMPGLGPAPASRTTISIQLESTRTKEVLVSQYQFSQCGSNQNGISVYFQMVTVN